MSPCRIEYFSSSRITIRIVKSSVEDFRFNLDFKLSTKFFNSNATLEEIHDNTMVE